MGDNKNTISVAIVDDDAPLRDGSVKRLENFGFEVLFQAGNGQEALQRLKEDNRLPDVFIIEEDFEATKVLLATYPDLKVLISSTNDDEESVVAMLKMGVSGYVLKFVDPEELLTAISALGENRKYFSVAISKIATEYFK